MTEKALNTEAINNLLKDLNQLKDELTVQANLGKAEAKEELEKLEPLYNEFKAKAEKVADVAGDTASDLKSVAELGLDSDSLDDVGTALEMAGEELKEAYSKIKDIFS